jgi:hypothetical protein
MVDHNHDRIKTTGGGKICDEIDRQRGKGDSHVRQDRDKWWGHWVGISFHLLTKGTTLNIFSNIGAKASEGEE